MNAWRDAAARYGFVEYDGPPLEPLELYVEKSGEEIVEQLYHFVDRGGRQVALRPEMTPTLARMVGARARSMRMPVRWFSMPQLFRYERTQRGRLREHWQWNVDVLGEPGVAADVEVLAVALEGLRLLGLGSDDVVARVSDRRLLEKLLVNAGVKPDRLGDAYAAIDKLGREDEATTRDRLTNDADLSPAAVEKVFRIFSCESREQIAEVYSDVAGLADELERLSSYMRDLDELGFTDFVVFDPRIVRGLAYYTGIVFEIFDRSGVFRAICGGGRYDQLLGTISGVDLPAVGFGMGDVVLGELLDERDLLRKQLPGIDYYLVAVSDSERPMARRIACSLRQAGHSVIYALRQAGVGRQFKEADARGARHVVIVGPDELADDLVIVREMKSGVEQRVPVEDLLR